MPAALLKRVISSLVGATLAIAHANADDTAAAFVAFEAPRDWRVIDEASGDGRFVRVFQIPNPADQDTPHSANATIIVKEARGSSLADFALATLQRATASLGATLLERFEGGEPTIDVFHFYRLQMNAVPYIGAERLSARGNWLIQVRVAWPLLESSTDAWEDRMLAGANAILRDVEVAHRRLGPFVSLRRGIATGEGVTVPTIYAALDPE
jgi:hypothetical protein